MTMALFVAEQLARYAPPLFLAFQKIISAPNVTADEIRAKRKEVEAQKFTDLVPHSEIPVAPVVVPATASPGNEGKV